MSVPMSSIMVANVCRPQWKVISFWIPARSTHRLMHSFVGLGEPKSSNTLSVGLPRSPISSAACGVISRYSCPLVFFCLKMILVNSPCCCTSLHFIFWMSLLRSPVRQEKRNAFLTLSFSHGVSASFCSSSIVRYILVPSSAWIDSIPRSGFVLIIPLSYAWLMHARNLLKYEMQELLDSLASFTLFRSSFPKAYALFNRYSLNPSIHLGVISLNVRCSIFGSYFWRCFIAEYQFPQFPLVSSPLRFSHISL